MEKENEQESFRFTSKKEYEKELSRLISLRNSVSSKKKTAIKAETIDEQYENLMEEYLMFCSVGKDG